MKVAGSYAASGMPQKPCNLTNSPGRDGGLSAAVLAHWNLLIRGKRVRCFQGAYTRVIARAGTNQVLSPSD
jgi:hypothetical protein